VKIVVVGASGTIGSAVAAALRARHEVIPVSRRGDRAADLEDADSLRRLLAGVKGLGAVVSCAGSAAFKPLPELTDADFQVGLRSKLMGQVNLARIAAEHLADGGSITLTGGVLAHEPMPGGSAISLVNAALEGFVLGAALDLPRGLRINLVSPPWILETLAARNMQAPGAISAAACARAYVAAVEGAQTGQTIDARKFA
jgi:NAD(P)-dependent dehydrogenase (short-subunit alcohol dehydrogenase family)